MRFLENGPSIPDRLLTARDEGRVVFFCGAGVSRARAGLLDFYGLAEQVIDLLGVPESNAARRILDAAKSVGEATGLSGLISADGVFGFLEQDFDVRDIEQQVARSLKPIPAVDLSAHQILIRLARTQEGRLQLVTTNFDRLFEQCDGQLKAILPPKLPNLAHGDLLSGIIHLHGVVNSDYSGSESGPFVLSTSQFGRAYLSDTWATNFIKAVLDRYLVVFVGYAADDPPVKYLLEALNTDLATRRDIFAFQSGEDNEAVGRWRQKGVTPITYTVDPGHSPLWDTLSEWAGRADSPDAWVTSVIDAAQRGPEVLRPHERGQIKHIVSTLEGARRFANTENAPPATWLCAFDPSIRYQTPEKTGDDEIAFDPFKAYGLDDDEVPPPVDLDDFYAKREIPEGAWELFEATQTDIQTLDPKRFSNFHGFLSKTKAELPRRLFHMGQWLSKVAADPAAVWWAAQKSGLHPQVRLMIEREVYGAQVDCSDEIVKAWTYLFESWSSSNHQNRHEWFDYKRRVRREGWNEKLLRDVFRTAQPYLTHKKPYHSNVSPPAENGELRLKDLMRIDIEYPQLAGAFEIGDDWLLPALRFMRTNLELAVNLENEVGSYDLRSLVPINSSDDVDEDSRSIERYSRTHGLSGYVLFFVGLFKRLIEIDAKVAHSEMILWPTDDDYVFARMRIWAAGDERLTDANFVGSYFAALDNEAFWDGYHQRDLLLSVARRWSQLEDSWRRQIGQKLLSGPDRWQGEEDAKYIQRKAAQSLERLYWLRTQGCVFEFDFDAETARLLSQAPDWKVEYASGAVSSREGRSGWVRTVKSYDALIDVPLNRVLSEAVELSGRDREFFVEHDPFAGYVADFPLRAFSALSVAARNGEYPEWAWRTFLHDGKRQQDAPRFMRLIAGRIRRVPAAQLTATIYPICEWLLKVSGSFAEHSLPEFKAIISHLTNLFGESPDAFGSAIVRRGDDIDWTSEAINSPVGKLAEALMEDPSRLADIDGQGFSADWLDRWNSLFQLPNDLGCFALVIAAHNLPWLFYHAPVWTEAQLLSRMDKQGAEADAIWFGFLWGLKQGPSFELFQKIRLNLFHKASDRAIERHGYQEKLSALLLFGWGTQGRDIGERGITDQEMRNVLLRSDESLRLNILWTLKRWSEPNEENGPWPDLLPGFLRDVWPRQKSVKSPGVSAQLCDIAFASSQRFEEIAGIVIDLVTPVTDDRFLLPDLRDEGLPVIREHPLSSLALLFAILSDDVEHWPYGFEDVLEALNQCGDAVRSDPKFVELNRRWNAR